MDTPRNDANQPVQRGALDASAYMNWRREARRCAARTPRAARTNAHAARSVVVMVGMKSKAAEVLKTNNQQQRHRITTIRSSSNGRTI